MKIRLLFIALVFFSLITGLNSMAGSTRIESFQETPKHYFNITVGGLSDELQAQRLDHLLSKNKFVISAKTDFSKKETSIVANKGLRIEQVKEIFVELGLEINHYTEEYK